VNRTPPPLHGRPLEITLTVPLIFKVMGWGGERRRGLKTIKCPN